MSLLLEEMEDIDKLLDEADQFYKSDKSMTHLIQSKSISKQTKGFVDDVFVVYLPLLFNYVFVYNYRKVFFLPT